MPRHSAYSIYGGYPECKAPCMSLFIKKLVSLRQDQQAFAENLLRALTTGKGDLKNRKENKIQPWNHQEQDGVTGFPIFANLVG